MNLHPIPASHAFKFKPNGQNGSKKDVTKELTESHIDALYEAMDELMYESFEALEKYTEERQE